MLAMATNNKLLHTAFGSLFRTNCKNMLLNRSFSSGCHASWLGEGEKNPMGNQSTIDDDLVTSNTIYKVRKFSHSLPLNTVKPKFETLKAVPTGAFRCTEGENLGKERADKDGDYKNPEYFSYHHMSYYDFNLHMKIYRKQSEAHEKELMS